VIDNALTLLSYVAPILAAIGVTYVAGYIHGTLGIVTTLFPRKDPK
jgi:hypothetical protein